MTALQPLVRPTFHDDPLFRLQLCVAQRADELARISPSGGGARRDLETWTRAEQEFFPLKPTSVRSQRPPTAIHSLSS